MMCGRPRWKQLEPLTKRISGLRRSKLDRMTFKLQYRLNLMHKNRERSGRQNEDRKRMLSEKQRRRKLKQPNKLGCGLSKSHRWRQKLKQRSLTIIE